jgi:hypothetical protein
VGTVTVQHLGVGVGADELDAAHVTVDHVADGVAATAANANDLDAGALVERFFVNHFDGHFFLLVFQ